MRRRIDKSVLDLLILSKLDSADISFLKGCLKCQKAYPQLTIAQWEKFQVILKKYHVIKEKEENMTEQEILKEMNTWGEASRWFSRHGYGMEQIRLLELEWNKIHLTKPEVIKEIPQVATSTPPKVVANKVVKQETLVNKGT